MHGADRTSAAGERWAAYIALKAIKQSRNKKPVVMLIDNLSVCDQLIRLRKRGWQKPGQCVSQWKVMFDSSNDTPIDFYWVPSHRKAKNASWRPMREFNDEDMEAKAEDWRNRNQGTPCMACLPLPPGERTRSSNPLVFTCKQCGAEKPRGDISARDIKN